MRWSDNKFRPPPASERKQISGGFVSKGDRTNQPSGVSQWADVSLYPCPMIFPFASASSALSAAKGASWDRLQGSDLFPLLGSDISPCNPPGRFHTFSKQYIVTVSKGRQRCSDTSIKSPGRGIP